MRRPPEISTASCVACCGTHRLRQATIGLSQEEHSRRRIAFIEECVVPLLGGEAMVWNQAGLPRGRGELKLCRRRLQSRPSHVTELIWQKIKRPLAWPVHEHEMHMSPLTRTPHEATSTHAPRGVSPFMSFKLWTGFTISYCED